MSSTILVGSCRAPPITVIAVSFQKIYAFQSTRSDQLSFFGKIEQLKIRCESLCKILNISMNPCSLGKIQLLSSQVEAYVLGRKRSQLKFPCFVWSFTLVWNVIAQHGQTVQVRTAQIMPRVDLFFEKWFKFSKIFKEHLIMKNKNKKS